MTLRERLERQASNWNDAVRKVNLELARRLERAGARRLRARAEDELARLVSAL